MPYPCTSTKSGYAYLQQMIGVCIDPADLAKPFSPEQLAKARPSNQNLRSVRALMIAREGWSLRDILAHGVIDFQPVVAGTAKEVADHMQAWFEAGAVDGFWISPDVNEDGDAFVDCVVPLLQERGLFHQDYEGKTLRHYIGAPDQYGIDGRV